MSKNSCLKCGSPVDCGLAQGRKTCWCAELPAVMSLTGNPKDCLCRDCLEAEVSARITVEKKRAGLCADCRSARRVRTKGGVLLYLCERSTADPYFPKYPRLPMEECPSHEKWSR